MKDCFNWIGCKSSKKGRYIQLICNVLQSKIDVNHLKKEGISNHMLRVVHTSQDVNHLKKEGISNAISIDTSDYKM